MRPPHQGYAPETLQYQHNSLERRYTPEGSRSGTWPALILLNTQKGKLTDKDRHHRDTIIGLHTYKYHIASQTQRTANADKDPNTETRKSGFRGGAARRRPDQSSPPRFHCGKSLRLRNCDWQSQLRFVIAIAWVTKHLLKTIRPAK